MVEEKDKLILSRTRFLLENRIKDPSYLLGLWKLTGPAYSSQVPLVEKISPWWKGLFDDDT